MGTSGSYGGSGGRAWGRARQQAEDYVADPTTDNAEELISDSIVIYRSGVNLEDQEQWPDFYGWLLERCERFKATFAPRLQNMDLPEAEDATVVAPAAAADIPASEPAMPAE